MAMAARHKTMPIQKIGEWWIGRRSLVSRFRSSSHFAEPRFELRNRKDTSKPLIKCGFGSEVRMTNPRATMMRTSKPPHWQLVPFHHLVGNAERRCRLASEGI